MAPPSKRIRRRPTSITRNKMVSVAAMEIRARVLFRVFTTKHVSCRGDHVERSYGGNEVDTECIMVTHSRCCQIVVI